MLNEAEDLGLGDFDLDGLERGVSRTGREGEKADTAREGA